MSLEKFYGTYLGFCPTDKSSMNYGEYRAIVGESGISFEFATGIELEKQVFDAVMLNLTIAPAKITKPYENATEYMVATTITSPTVFHLILEPGDRATMLIGSLTIGDFTPPVWVVRAETCERYEEIVHAFLADEGETIHNLPRIALGGEAINVV